MFIFISLSLCSLCCIITVLIQWATVLFLSLYCYVIVSLNEINIGCKKKAKVGGPAKPKVKTSRCLRRRQMRNRTQINEYFSALLLLLQLLVWHGRLVRATSLLMDEWCQLWLVEIGLFVVACHVCRAWKSTPKSMVHTVVMSTFNGVRVASYRPTVGACSMLIPRKHVRWLVDRWNGTRLLVAPVISRPRPGKCPRLFVARMPDE